VGIKEAIKLCGVGWQAIHQGKHQVQGNHFVRGEVTQVDSVRAIRRLHNYTGYDYEGEEIQEVEGDKRFLAEMMGKASIRWMRGIMRGVMAARTYYDFESGATNQIEHLSVLPSQFAHHETLYQKSTTRSQHTIHLVV
jgi:hypothetical protein